MRSKSVERRSFLANIHANIWLLGQKSHTVFFIIQVSLVFYFLIFFILQCFDKSYYCEGSLLNKHTVEALCSK